MRKDPVGKAKQHLPGCRGRGDARSPCSGADGRERDVKEIPGFISTIVLDPDDRIGYGAEPATRQHGMDRWRCWR